jgi:phosphoglucosamine mutase
VLEAVIQSKKTLAQLSASLVMYPQVLINIKTDKKINVDQHADIQSSVVMAEKELAGTGRVLLRSSGTEPKIRVMVEGENQLQVETLAQRIADVVVIATSG